MKKRALLVWLLLFALLLASCGETAPAEESPEAGGGEEITELTLWTFPVGGWDDPTTVSSILAGFHREHPDIHISVEYLDYETGDARVERAVADGTAPDLILEGPERLIAAWGEQGWMADLSSLWESEKAGEIYNSVRLACRHRNRDYYVFPICMSAHCMAINYDMFQKADALRFLDQETHTWTTEGFLQAVRALRDYGLERVGVLYCKNQSGDQGTRALVNNLYGGSFTNRDHTVYTIDSEKNRKALQVLYDLEGVTFEPSLSSMDAIEQFCRKETAMCFCWNASLEVQQTINNPDLDFDVFPMAFPSQDGVPELQGGIWGFGVFDNGSEARIEAAKTFIRYISEDDGAYAKAVQATSYWPVRDTGSLYENDTFMAEYSIFTPYMGDYYQITPGWTDARAAWWQMLAKIGDGVPVEEAVKNFPSPG